MNPLTILSLIQTATQLLPQIQALFKGGVAGITPASVTAALGDAEPALAELGGMISPSAEAAVHATVGVIAAFAAGDTIKGIQGALNVFLGGTTGYTPLVVDGKYGPRTAAAIVMAQTKAGVKPDGWFGKITATAIGYVMK